MSKLLHKSKKSGKKGAGKVFVITDFAEAMLKMQKNVLATWEPIWDIA